ncbi:class I SAM-dependent methyltransferase [Acidobacteria bacterium AH-259-A15]|nr:class I SAM-dependent methyltransferase [Acidobacteria bacterium AH-259-A15]
MLRHILRLLKELLTTEAARVGRLKSQLYDRGDASPERSSHEALVVNTMTKYDMVSRPDEPYYARQYLHWILSELCASYPDRRVKIVDLGCGQGRLSLPLAEWCATRGGQVTGVDFTLAAVERARSYATARGLANVAFQHGDLLVFARAMADGSVDAVLLIEVTFILPSYRQVLREIQRVLRPGGLLFVSFRSQHYNLLHSVRSRRWDGADMVITQREGHIFGGPCWFSWQTPDDICRLITESRLHLIKLLGIGICSGIEGDPLAAIVRPSQLLGDEQDRLMQIECAVAKRYAACGRYILAIARRRRV